MNRFFILLGILLIALGAAAPLLEKSWLGHLPGDFVIDRGNMKIYIPLTTCVLLSLALSAIVWVLKFFARR